MCLPFDDHVPCPKSSFSIRSESWDCKLVSVGGIWRAKVHLSLRDILECRNDTLVNDIFSCHACLWVIQIDLVVELLVLDEIPKTVIEEIGATETTSWVHSLSFEAQWLRIGDGICYRIDCTASAIEQTEIVSQLRRLAYIGTDVREKGYRT